MRVSILIQIRITRIIKKMKKFVCASSSLVTPHGFSCAVVDAVGRYATRNRKAYCSSGKDLSPPSIFLLYDFQVKLITFFFTISYALLHRAAGDSGSDKFFIHSIENAENCKTIFI